MPDENMTASTSTTVATEGADATQAAAVEKEPEDQRVPYERFQTANQKAKEANDRATKLEKDLADLKAQLDERESAGLPELERERKAREAVEKRLAEAEKRAEDADKAVQRTTRERWVAAAASRESFVDPDDAARYIDLDGIEDADAAERAVKRLAKTKQHLVKAEDGAQPQIGRVLENGKTTASKDAAKSSIDLDEEAQALAAGLKSFIRN